MPTLAEAPKHGTPHPPTLVRGTRKTAAHKMSDPDDLCAGFVGGGGSMKPPSACAHTLGHISRGAMRSQESPRQEGKGRKLRQQAALSEAGWGLGARPPTSPDGQAPSPPGSRSAWLQAHRPPRPT